MAADRIDARSRREAAQAMAEFIVVLPVLLLVVLAGLQLGSVFLQYQQLSSAVSEGARRGIVSATYGDREGRVTSAVRDAAPNLDGTVGVSVSSSWVVGEPLTVTGTYPAEVDVLGLVVWSGNLTNTRTMRVAN